MASKIGRAAFWAIAGSGVQNLTSFGLLLYLAHVLAPRDFGLMATVAVGLDLGLHVARWGQSELIQQDRYDTEEHRTQGLLTSLAVSALFAGLFLVIAQPLALHYGTPELAVMFYLCAPIFVLSAPRSIAEAMLRRMFRFRLIAVRNNVTTVVGALVAILLVMRGYGPLALAIQRLVQTILSTVWIWVAVAWRPRLARLRYAPDLFGEGARLMAGTVLPLLVPRTIDFLVGFLLGPAQLGLMRIALRVNDFVAQTVIIPLVGVASAEMGGLSRNREELRRAYLRLTQASAGLMCPALIGLALVAPEAVPLLFGPQWHDSVPLVRIASLLALVAPVNYYFMPVMVAVGESRLVLRQGIFQTAIGIVLAAVGAAISLPAVIAAHVARGLIVSLYNIVDLKRYVGLSYRTLGGSMAPPLAGSALMVAAVLSTRAALGPTLPPVERLLICLVVGVFAYLGTIHIGSSSGWWPNPYPARLRALRLFRGRKAAGPPSQSS